MTNPRSNQILSPEEFDVLTRIDFWIFTQRVFAELTGEPFLDNWHIQLLCAELDRVRTTPNTCLAIALPPRSLKSIIASVALPAWLLGHNPGIEIVCVSYGQELADKLSSDCRRIIQSPWFQRVFPATRLVRQKVDHLATTQGGKRYATSVGGTLTGIGAHVIIVDDPMKPDEALSDAERARANQWARHTLFTRMNNKTDNRIVIVQQRLHEDDMIGHVMGVGGFNLMSFPAIAQDEEEYQIKTPFGVLTHTRKAGEALHPAREPIEALEQQKRWLGTDYFAAQYLQSPTPPGGGLVKTAWFNRYDLADKPRFRLIVQSWDCASKASQLADFSVSTTWGVTAQKDVYLLHVYRQRLEYPELKRKVVVLAREFRAGAVLIEDAAAGIQLVQELKRGGIPQITPVKAQGDKEMRMRAQTAMIEAGKVFIPREASWVDDYLHEMAMFPKGKHDDQVDSTAHALAHIGKPDPSEVWIEYYRQEALRSHGINPDDVTVTFDHIDPDSYFQINQGRKIRREGDGFYHVTPLEWETFRGMLGVMLIDGIDW